MKFNLIVRILWAALFVLLAAALAFKGLHVDDFIYTRTGVKFLGILQVLANDSLIFAFIITLLYLSLLPWISRPLSMVARAVALVAFAVYVIDCLVIVNFNTHLVLSDVLKYGGYAPDYLRQIYGRHLPAVIFAALILPASAILIVSSRLSITRKAGHGAAIAAILILFSGSFLSDSEKYIHSWIYKNFIAYNLSVLSESAAYSDEFTDNFNYRESERCHPQSSEFPNVIVLMVESLSSYQSEFFSGLENWTPHIDEIARRNIAFQSFHANGFTTEDGEIAILTGRLPVYPPASYTNGGGASFNGFFGVEESLATIFNDAGYRTEFLTTADLSFADSGRWAKSIGFDQVEGHEQAWYQSWDRFQFRAAPDRALYERIFDRVHANGANRLFFFVKTVTSHHPFVNPETRNRSESETIRYVDRQLGTFYRRLTESGFFDNGLLIIVGDHRAMVPIRKEETTRFGPLRAAARVPLIISYAGRKNRVDRGSYQQIDIFNSLKNLVSGTRCNSEWAGDLLGADPTPPRYIAHRRGDRRDLVSIFSSDGDFLIKLDGDHTRLIGPHPPGSGDWQVLVDKINAARLRPEVRRIATDTLPP